ncbi:hypothetical protein THOM_0981 [Trachipleistophora hominis]|uniref:CBF1-interacting co-repressor CIR N-terminal domain-containing protein n=1 Tax=Trachipleistophora hominis TaxID=72359 RepID=L7JZ54_TRAHO|nr:hypothetical protein THOM_0981 [Trachipleistophora hominis]
MAKNINCKKSWHPTRFEIQSKIHEYKMKEDEKEKRKQLIASELEEEERCFGEVRRMKWMEENH